jgi:hypothetical protein
MAVNLIRANLAADALPAERANPQPATAESVSSSPELAV